MQNLWDNTEAATHSGDLGEITYGSRLVGSDPALVLHGGGNTSIKSFNKDVHGEAVEVLYVKGSGWDLATIEPPGFAPLRLEPVRRLAELPALSDTEMVNQLRLNLLDASAPNPSVEAILHACLPYKSVLHTHADAVLALTNTTDGRKQVAEVWGDRVVVIPYVMPGFDLARVCAEQFNEQSHGGTEAMVLLNHGIFTFSETTRDAYDSMIRLITEAENYLASRGGVAQFGVSEHTATSLSELTSEQALVMAELRSQVSNAAGRPLLLSRTTGDGGAKALEFCQGDNVGLLAQRGPATPDHIIRTKQFPLVRTGRTGKSSGEPVADFVSTYEAYFERNQERLAKLKQGKQPDQQIKPSSSAENLTMLDPAPRVILDPELGLLTAGKSTNDCKIASDIYLHTISVIEASEQLDQYVALDENHLFDVEYWELEQAKLRLGAGGSSAAFSGQVAVVTGAASGIGKATAQALASQGATVAGLDIDQGITATFDHDRWLGLETDVTDPAAIAAGLVTVIEHFGGIDIVVIAAGAFGPSAPIADLDFAQWQRTLDLNLTSVASTLQCVHRYLRLSPTGGRVVLVGSKNVLAPGTHAGAYSASKAAVAQLGRVAALEWAADNITVNTIHPDAVFDTGLWSDELIEQRANSYGITSEQYRRRNLLGREITAADVGLLVAELCNRAFGATTGTQIPIDGGSDRVI